MKKMLYIAVLLWLALLEVYAQKKLSRPNVVFILADDMVYHDLSCTGSTYYETPNIDHIAKQSAVAVPSYLYLYICST